MAGETLPGAAPHDIRGRAGGGGVPPRPGEISLANHGLLFLDELGEFGRSILDVLREPLESGRVSIVRAACQAVFPARFQLVAAMNPCPCGYLGDGTNRCRCLPEAVRRYQARVSGPLIDRFDLHLPMVREPPDETLDPGGRDGAAGPARGPDSPERTSAAVRARVGAACELQLARGGKLNRDLDPAEIARTCPLDSDARALLRAATRRLALSERAVQRVLRVARTIADLDGGWGTAPGAPGRRSARLPGARAIPPRLTGHVPSGSLAPPAPAARRPPLHGSTAPGSVADRCLRS